MAQTAQGAQALGTLGLGVHSNRPCPPQPGHGTVFSCDDLGFMPSSEAAGGLTRENPPACGAAPAYPNPLNQR